ncbi:MAG: S10 family peptidase [Prosthecobacter sp.]|uniref:S10 family peptidase n=1 Tax=Prosthecobacter sp. TaxID=1965333 RepID=UPI0038FDE67C
MRLNSILLSTLLPALMMSVCLSAEEAKPNKPDATPEVKKEEKKDEKKPEADKPVVTEGKVMVGGKEIAYKATAGTLPILKPDGKPSAQVFYTAYTMKDVKDAGSRPVTFCFNGGPGSSSVWLHLGAFGPKRVDLPADGLTPPKPPGGLVNNEFSLLDVTDLVFIDPVNTGFSRAEDPKNLSEFLGVEEDIKSVGEFMRLWVTREQRWRSPKFIAGESYGGIRGGGLAQHLQQRHRMYLNGLIIVSGLLDYDVLIPGPLNDLPYEVLLPAMTATAHYHKKLPADLQADFKKAVAESREFAFGEYARVLLKGSDLPKAERDVVVQKLARLTGLEPKLIDEQHLRIDSGVFREMLLRKERLVIGAYDARVTGRDGDESEQHPQIEPFMRVVGSVAAASMNAYLREELKYEKDLPYEVLAPQPNWNHGKGNGYTSVSGQLADAIKQNPHLKVLALVGWRDLVTPPDNMLHSLRQMHLPEELRPNIEVAEYESGHMMYTNRPDMEKMHADIAAFIAKALK